MLRDPTIPHVGRPADVLHAWLTLGVWRRELCSIDADTCVRVLGFLPDNLSMDHSATNALDWAIDDGAAARFAKGTSHCCRRESRLELGSHSERIHVLRCQLVGDCAELSATLE
jgi:hypothetical protein